MASPLTLSSVAESLERPMAIRSDSFDSSASSSLARRPRVRGRTGSQDGPGWSDKQGALENHSTRTQDEGEHDSEAGVASDQSPGQFPGQQHQLTVNVDNSTPPPRPARSPRRSTFLVEQGELDIPAAVPRDRKISSASGRSAASSRGQAASLQELLDLKNVCVFVIEFLGLYLYPVTRPSLANELLACHAYALHLL